MEPSGEGAVFKPRMCIGPTEIYLLCLATWLEMESRVKVTLTAHWGNDDAESTIKVSMRRWKAIQLGAEHSTRAWGWYEGNRFAVCWHFNNSEYSIDASDGAQCVVEAGVAELMVSLPSQE